MPPAQAIDVLNGRMKHVNQLNAQIADWLQVGSPCRVALRSLHLQERRRVEEAYVQGLRKLANKRPPDESSDMGYGYTLPHQAHALT